MPKKMKITACRPRCTGLFGVLLALVAVVACESGSEVAETPASERLLMQGTEALKVLDFQQALALADSAGKLAPRSASVHFLRARIYSELGRFARAETEYRKVLEIEPSYRGVWNNLGNNAFRQQRFEQAIEYYKMEFAVHPAPIPYRGIGRAYVELGEVDSARAAFLKAIALDSTYDSVHLSLSLLYEDEGDFKRSLYHARRAWELDPENLEYRYTYGTALVKTGRYREALAHLQVVAKAWPWYHGAQYNLGQALVRLGRKKEAKKYLDEAERVRAVEAKIEHLENTVRSLPDDPFAYAALGFALRRAGRYNDAMHSYKVAQFLAPHNVEISNNIANLYLIKRDTTRAIAQYREILAHDPRQVDVWLNLGVVYALAKDYAAAKEAWRTVLKYVPDHPAARAYLAKVAEEEKTEKQN